MCIKNRNWNAEASCTDCSFHCEWKSSPANVTELFQFWAIMIVCLKVKYIHWDVAIHCTVLMFFLWRCHSKRRINKDYNTNDHCYHRVLLNWNYYYATLIYYVVFNFSRYLVYMFTCVWRQASSLCETVTGQNGIGQNGTDKMVRTKRHGQNGSNFYRFQFNWIEFLFSNHKSQISAKPKWV